MSTAYNKTTGTEVLAWATTATAAVTESSVQDVSTKVTARLIIHMGRASGTAFTAGWPLVRVEVSGADTGDDAWAPTLVFAMPIGASIASTTANGAITATDTACSVASATNIAAGDVLFLGHTTDPTKYEIVRVKSISGTTVTFEEACTYDHDSGCAITDQAEIMTGEIALDTIERLRVVVDNSNGGQSVHCRVIMNTLDSVG
jgi:hypothetical protein